MVTGSKLQQVAVAAAHGHLRRCLAMWKVIHIYITKYPDTKVITAKPVKERIKNLESKIKVQLPDAGQPSTKHSGEDISSPQMSKRPTRRQSPPDLNVAENIMAQLTVSLEDRMTYLNR